jgi:hypothetical protein
LNFYCQVPNNPSAQPRTGEDKECLNLWEDLEEPPIEVDELDSLFALPETQKREPKKASDEAAKPTKITAKGYLDPKRAQNVWIMAKNLMKNNLDIERLEHAIYNVDLADLSYDIMMTIKEHMVCFNVGIVLEN